jgi:uncharacterized repeat protein (TIGR03803 family)
MPAKEFVMRPSRFMMVIFVSLVVLVVASSSDAQNFTSLYSFSSTDGAYPNAVLTQGRDGYLYGTTSQGGIGTCASNTGCGTIFKMDTSGNLTTLYKFSGTDGSSPQGVILGTDGNLYGVAQLDGPQGFGRLFRITSNGTFTSLHDFTGGADGSYPSNQLFQAPNGDFYGFSSAGLYRYVLSGTLTTIHTFAQCSVYHVFVPLILGADENLYATFPCGDTGLGSQCGSIVKFNSQGTVLSQHDFGCNSHQITGNYPLSSVVSASDGDVYGTNSSGGTYGYGTVFRLDPRNDHLNILHTFNLSTDGTSAGAVGLVQANDRNFYSAGGGGVSGVIYQLTLGGQITTLLDIPNYGEDFLYSSFIQHTNGQFYSSINFIENDPTFYGLLYSFDNQLDPFVSFVQSQGKIGGTAQILGQGFRGSTGVTFNGIPATSFKVVADTYMTAVVPSGATTGKVVVTTPGGTLTSNVSFRIVQ